MNGDFIKLNRSILQWEWYGNINTCRLFIHMLLKANWKDGRFEGATVPRGSFVSSIGALADETELTNDEVRTAMKHLLKTGEITKQSTNKFTVFSVVNYDLYQMDSQATPKQLPSSSQTIPKLFPTIEEKKEGKKEIIEKNTKREFFPNDAELNQAFADYVDMRKKIKAPMTERAINLAINKLAKLSGNNRDVSVLILEQSIMNSWNGLFPLKECESASRGKRNLFNNFNQRKYDYDQLEKMMLNSKPGT